MITLCIAAPFTAIQVNRKEIDDVTYNEVVVLRIDCILVALYCAVFCYFIIPLAWFHSRLISRNLTTQESVNKKFAHLPWSPYTYESTWQNWLRIYLKPKPVIRPLLSWFLYLKQTDRKRYDLEVSKLRAQPQLDMNPTPTLYKVEIVDQPPPALGIINNVGQQTEQDIPPSSNMSL